MDSEPSIPIEDGWHEEETPLTGYDEKFGGEIKSGAATPLPTIVKPSQKPRTKQRKYNDDTSSSNSSSSSGIMEPQQIKVKKKRLRKKRTDYQSIKGRKQPNGGSAFTYIPLISTGIKRISQFLLKHNKGFNASICIVLLLCAAVIVSNIVIIMVYDSKSRETNIPLDLAPFSVIKLPDRIVTQQAGIYLDKAIVELGSHSVYSGLIQIALGSKTKPMYNNIKLSKFKKLVRYWPNNSSANGTISCETPLNVSWEWQKAYKTLINDIDSMEQGCDNSWNFCTPENPIHTDYIFIDKGPDDNLVTIKPCETEQTLKANLLEETFDLKEMELSNLAIGENKNSTEVSFTASQLYTLKHIYISTKYVHTPHVDYEHISVNITVKESGIVWEVSAGVISFIVMVMIITLVLCGVTNMLYHKKFHYFTVVLHSMKR